MLCQVGRPEKAHDGVDVAAFLQMIAHAALQLLMAVRRSGERSQMPRRTNRKWPECAACRDSVTALARRKRMAALMLQWICAGNGARGWKARNVIDAGHGESVIEQPHHGDIRPRTGPANRRHERQTTTGG